MWTLRLLSSPLTFCRHYAQYYDSYDGRKGGELYSHHQTHQLQVPVEECHCCCTCACIPYYMYALGLTREVEHGCFSPLVSSVSGGMGTTARIVYKKLGAMIASKHSQSYSQTINWLRCRLSFSLLRSCIMCLRGSRSSVNHPAVHPQIQEAVIEQALNDGRVATI